MLDDRLMGHLGGQPGPGGPGPFEPPGLDGGLEGGRMYRTMSGHSLAEPELIGQHARAAGGRRMSEQVSRENIYLVKGTVWQYTKLYLKGPAHTKMKIYIF